MTRKLPDDLAALLRSFDAVTRDARVLADGLDERGSEWRAHAGAWSIAECLDHLAVSNRAYLLAMEEAAAEASENGHRRRSPARPGWIGGLLVRSLEPPVRRIFRARAPRASHPRVSPPLHDALEQFSASQNEVRAFLLRYANLDLTGTRFENPFIPWMRFSLATGLHVLAAHQRRHLWQAWCIRHEMMSFYAGNDAQAVHASRSDRDAGTHDWA